VPRRPSTLYAFALGILLAASSVAVHAEVIEIADDGAVTVHRGSSIYTSEGVRPITATPPVPRMASNTAVTEMLRVAAQRQSINADLLEAVAWRESRLRHTAVSPKGAIGVMQIMPSTAAALGIDGFDVRQNIEGGATYLRQMLNRYGGNLALALAAYNAGPGAVDRYRGVPPYRETQAYVAAIINRLAARPAVAASPLSPLIEP